MGKFKSLKPTLAALIALGCLPADPANAGPIEISPVSVNLVAGQNATTIELKNRGGGSAAFQIRAYSWAQAGNTDTLATTRDVIISPPIFTVPAGASQTVRLLLRGAAGAAGERSYRLLLDEVPAANSQNYQVAIAFRISLPVIAAAASAPARNLQWRAARGPGRQILLSATNIGNVYDKVHAIAVTLPDGSHPKITPGGGNAYLLAGAQRHWVVQDSTLRDTLRLSLTTQAGKSEQTLVVDP